MASIIHTANVQGPLTKAECQLARFATHSELLKAGFKSVGAIGTYLEADYARFYMRDDGRYYAIRRNTNYQPKVF